MRIERSICAACGYTGGQLKQIPGSFVIELVLWLFFAVPGLIYSLWRLTSAKGMCPSCAKDAMIPTGSPRGAEMLAERGGWSASAEDSYLRAAKIEWRSLAVWAAFSWFWVLVWGACGAAPAAIGSSVVAGALTVVSFVRFPRRTT
jgi:hypothetical protein